MASVVQLESWHAKARERVEKYKALVKEETRKKKELGRPKTPQQIQIKEDTVKLLLRYQDEFDFAKQKEKEWEDQLKEARKEEKNLVPKSALAVSKVLSKKFSKTAVHADSIQKKPLAKTKTADNRIQLPLKNQEPVELSLLQSMLEELMNNVRQIDVRLKKLEGKS